jgi:hypothetical protein
MSITPFNAVSRAATISALAAALFAASPALASNHEHTTGSFAGVKADRGTVTHRIEGGRHVLVLSDDFKIPDAPDPHWQLVDSKGATFLLDRLVVKPDQTLKRTIVVPAYVADVSRVQMWCAYAEVLLGEAKFESPISTRPAVQARAAPKQARTAQEAGSSAVYASTSRAAIDRVYGH